MKDPFLIHESCPSTHKEDKTKIKINSIYIQLNTGVKEIKQLNPCGLDKSSIEHV